MPALRTICGLCSRVARRVLLHQFSAFYSSASCSSAFDSSHSAPVHSAPVHLTPFVLFQSIFA